MSRTQISENTRKRFAAGSQPRAETASQPGEAMDRALHARVLKRLASEERDFVLDVEFHAIPGFTILFGPSGAGKTTLLDCVAGFTMPEAGSITIGEQVLFDATKCVNLPPAKRRAGYVFQDLALFPHYTVEKNVEYGLSHLSRGERQGRAATILSAFRIDPLAKRRPKEISGGE